jgi:hypothetical protein
MGGHHSYFTTAMRSVEPLALACWAAQHVLFYAASQRQPVTSHVMPDTEASIGPVRLSLYNTARSEQMDYGNA